MSSPVIVIAQLEAKPEFAPQFRAALDPLIAATLQEAGCLRYQLHQDLDNPHSWMLYEVWESRASPTLPNLSPGPSPGLPAAPSDAISRWTPDLPRR
ncbi:hypothetical protein KOPIIPEJ_03564 [Aeromonas dhakensis]